MVRKENQIDLLRMYLQDISKYPLLKKEEELFLGQKILEVKYSIISHLTTPSNINLLMEYISDKIKEKPAISLENKLENEEDNNEEIEEPAENNPLNEQKLFSDFYQELTSLVQAKDYTSLTDSTKLFFKTLNKWKHLDNIIYSYVDETEFYQRTSSYPKKLLTSEKITQQKIKQLKKEYKYSLNKFTNSNLRLAVHIAKQYITFEGIDFLDVIQEANLGLMHAADKFLYDRGYRFSTYATHQIKQKINRFIAERTTTIKTPINFIELIKKINKTNDELYEENGFKLNHETIATQLGIEESEISKKIQQIPHIFSLDQPLTYENYNLTFLSNLADETSPSNLELTYLKEVKEMIMKGLSKLTPRERYIITMRFGIDNNSSHTLEEIGVKFKVTRERIRQIEARAIKKLQKNKSLNILYLSNFL